MAKYNIVYALSFDIEADDEGEAREIGFDELTESLKGHVSASDFGCVIEEKEE